MEYKSTVILIPVYNDWEVLNLLLERIKVIVSKQLFDKLEFVIVDDGSDFEFSFEQLFINRKIEVIRLIKNMGHQKAIAIGLSFIAENKKKASSMIIMDSDGEDKPEYILKLMKKHAQIPNKIIFSQRTKRKEGWLFKFCYNNYKLIFLILTGKKITFGNFCIIPSSLFTRIAMHEEIWHHFSGGIIKSKIPYEYIETEKGNRLYGKSKMNFSSLVHFGLSAIATHQEFVLIRILIFCFIITFLILTGHISVLFKKYFFLSVISGWTSGVLILFLILLMQTLLVSLFSFFLMLNSKNLKGIIPIKFYKDFILQIDDGGIGLVSNIHAGYFESNP